MAKKNGVQTVRAELANVIPQYAVISDCIEGEFAIKGFRRGYKNPLNTQAVSIKNEKAEYDTNLAKRYLPMPNPTDTSEENKARYFAYLIRAVFYNVTGHTLDGMVGEVFNRDPEITLPSDLAFMNDDADGNGIGLIQLAQTSVRNIVPYGRGGFFVDFPATNGSVTADDIENGVRPTIRFYKPWDVINWKTAKVNGEIVLSLVVLHELIDVSTTQFDSFMKDQYRVLFLDTKSNPPVYSQQLYQPGLDDKLTPQVIAVADATGNPLSRIPFRFVGSENNSVDVSKPPMFDLAMLNVGHYRNSADYEENAYLCGQPTIAASGLDENWVKNVLKGKLAIGSRGGIPLPPGATIEMLQADPNSMPADAMDKKERQMVALGAKLVQQQQVQRTATDALMEDSSETSILANVANNVSSAMQWALELAYGFISRSSGKIVFKLNTKFRFNQLSADDQSKLVANWQKGAISWSEMRSSLKKAGVASQADDEAKAEIKSDLSFILDFAAADLGQEPQPALSTTPPAPSNDPKSQARNKKARGVAA